MFRLAVFALLVAAASASLVAVVPKYHDNKTVAPRGAVGGISNCGKEFLPFSIGRKFANWRISLFWHGQVLRVKSSRFAWQTAALCHVKQSLGGPTLLRPISSQVRTITMTTLLLIETAWVNTDIFVWRQLQVTVFWTSTSASSLEVRKSKLSTKI